VTEHATEIARGERFEFGANWSRFLSRLNDDRIVEAEKSLCEMLGADSLEGKTFLDAGSGSGLFSLAARRLGARVRSFDFDLQSVACTAELRRRFYPEDEQWTVTEGSVLDAGFLKSLGTFDVVYSWGVLHHTGAMWNALANVAPLVAPDGLLFVSIYNDQGLQSRFWTSVKRLYNRAPRALRWLLLLPALVALWGPKTLIDFIKLQPFKSWRAYGGTRGMSAWNDVVDWVGGYPFEVARPEEIFAFYRGRGFALREMKTCGGRLGCNEFVFEQMR